MSSKKLELNQILTYIINTRGIKELQPTILKKDVISVNDDARLEREADVMGRSTLSSSNKTKQILSVELGAYEPGNRVEQQRTMNNPILLTRLENFHPNNPSFSDVSGNGTYATDYQTDHKQVENLVDDLEVYIASNNLADNIVILTGCHGDAIGNLIYTGDTFLDEDKKLANGSDVVTEVIDMKTLNRSEQQAQMRRTEVVLVLSWCYSGQTYKNIENYEIIE